MPETKVENSIVTAAILVIGDEILSGRTKDRNIGYIAEFLSNIGIDLLEVRIVPDAKERIIESLNALRKSYDYVFTTGGIGPTHDDITSDSVAAAFETGIDFDPRAVSILKAHYPAEELNEARMRMTRIPDGAELIENPVSKAPGFRLENVFVMAGVPAIMQAMLDEVAPLLKTGTKIHSETVDSGLPEGIVAKSISEIEDRYEGVMIGSYPYFNGQGHVTKIVLRSRSKEELASAVEETESVVKELRKQGNRESML